MNTPSQRGFKRRGALYAQSACSYYRPDPEGRESQPPCQALHPPHSRPLTPHQVSGRGGKGQQMDRNPINCGIASLPLSLCSAGRCCPGRRQLGRFSLCSASPAALGSDTATRSAGHSCTGDKMVGWPLQGEGSWADIRYVQSHRQHCYSALQVAVAPGTLSGGCSWADICYVQSCRRCCYSLCSASLCCTREKLVRIAASVNHWTVHNLQISLRRHP